MDDQEQRATSTGSVNNTTDASGRVRTNNRSNTRSTTNTSSTSQTQQDTAQRGLTYGTSRRNPYAPAEPALMEMIERARALGDNSADLTPQETSAISGITETAERNAGFNPEIERLAVDQFAGGGMGEGADHIRDAYDETSNYYRGILGDDMTGESNPYVTGLLSTIRDDVTNHIGGQFAVAGRSMSPAHANTLSEGITSAMAPILFDNYWKERGAQERAAAGLGSEARATAGALDETAGNVLEARGAGTDTLERTYDPFTRLAQAGAYEVETPVTRSSMISDLLTQLAGVGGDTENFGLNLSEGTLTGRTDTRGRSDTDTTTTSRGSVDTRNRSRMRGTQTGTQTTTVETDPLQVITGGLLGGLGLYLGSRKKEDGTKAATKRGSA